MRRREFLGVASGVALAWPLAAGAQQAMPVVGFLGSDSAELYANRLRALREGLQQAGYVEGRNVSIEYAGPRVATISCQPWQPIWFVVRSL
jgi:putative ABC transport system substrate-binding protein